MQPLDPAFPPWVQFVSALGPVFTAAATLTVGVIVAFIAYRQWRVAHEKLLLDLFDKRFAVYSEAYTTVREFFSAPKFEYDPLKVMQASPQPDLEDLQIARIKVLFDVAVRARFLFDDEVSERITKALDNFLEYLSSYRKSLASPEHIEATSQARKAAYREIDAFRYEFPEMVMRYMRITRRL